MESEIVRYIVKVGIVGEELPFDEMLSIYESAGVCLSSGDDFICDPLSAWWKPHIFEGLDFHYPKGFDTVEEGKRYREELRAPDRISLHADLAGDVELSRDVTLYGCLFEVRRGAV